MEQGLLYIILAYLIGSVPFGYLAGRLCGVDLREHGSHNIGATNAMRVLGHGWGSAVFVLDFLKGFLPLWWVKSHLGMDLVEYNIGQLGLLVGVMLAVILGHTYTCFLHFRGGKGVASMAGCLVAAFPLIALIAVVVWVVMMALTRYVSLSSLVAGMAMVIASLIQYVRPDGELRPVEWVVPCVLFLILVLVTFRHRANIVRICNGTEPKAFSKKKPD